MIEEEVVKQVQRAYDEALRKREAPNEAANQEGVIVESSDAWKKYQRREDSEQQFHLFALATTVIAFEALRRRAVKSKQGRLLIRQFLNHPTIKTIRNNLYRKGDIANGISSGLLRPEFGKPKVARSIRKNRIVAHQALSTGVSLKEVGLNKKGLYEDLLKGAIAVSSYAEEFSPFKLLRTLSASHVLHTAKMSVDMPAYHIRGEEVSKLYDYYSKGVKKASGKTLSSYDMTLGIFYDKGKLYGAKRLKNNTIVPNYQNILAEGALPVFTQTDVSKTAKLTPSEEQALRDAGLPIDKMGKVDKNVNQIFRKVAIEEGIDPRIFDRYNEDAATRKVAFVINKNRSLATKDLAVGYISKMFESGSRAIDHPFNMAAGFLEDKIDNIKEGDRKAFYSTIYDATSPRFGSGERRPGGGLSYDSPLMTQIKKMAKNVFVKGLGMLAVGMLANNLVGDTFGDEYRVENVAADAIKNAHMAYANIFSKGFFKDYQERQEEIMPGSTGFLPTLAIPAAFAMTGATFSFLKGINDKVKHGFGEAELKAGKKALNIDPLKKLFNDVNMPNAAIASDNIFNKTVNTLKGVPLIGGLFNGEQNRATRWGLVGAAIGTVLAAPLLPGAFAGESPDDLKEEYAGRKKVAIKANRGWIFGGEEYEGGKVKYYDYNWYAKLKNNTREKAIYGSREDAERLNPILHPFDYLRDPYRFEKEHSEDMPYPVWGMDVTYGSFVGKAFEATVGRLIKPTVINPELQKYTDSDIEEDSTINLKTRVSRSEAELIAEGKMLAPISPEFTDQGLTFKRGLSGTFEFGGFKGFMLETAIDQLGYASPLTPDPYLEISGSQETIAGRIKESNLGDIVGLGEAQRRIINTGAPFSSGRATNPLENNMPSWLPGDDTGYYIDFKHGNPFSKIENADSRLPGKGYASFYSYLDGVDPEYYPLINKYEILADVALGSKEYYSAKRELENKASRGELSEFESKKIQEINEQSRARQNPKEFRDDLSVGDVYTQDGLLPALGRGYWNTVSWAAQNPLETLGPLRIGSKLIHDRTDIEDYKRDNLFGNDMALWTRPVDHFSRATAYELADMLGSEAIPDEAIEHRAIDEYFDRLEFIKQRKIYKEARESGDIETQRSAKSKMEGTKVGAVATGLNSREDLFAAYRSMSGKEKEYFQSFAMKDDEDKRQEILATVSDDEARIYAKIWENRDAIKDMTEEELADFQVDDTAEYERKMDIADAEAKEFVSSTLGMPEENFSGWDPRIDMRDVKLRFLQVGGKEIRDYGYWQDDELEMLRKVAIMDDKSFLDKTDSIGRLVDKYNQSSKLEFQARKNLTTNNMHAKNIEVRDGNGSIEFIKQ